MYAHNTQPRYIRDPSQSVGTTPHFRHVLVTQRIESLKTRLRWGVVAVTFDGHIPRFSVYTAH